ncbi:hypothetical protein EVAR_73691_1 [Eumeta japonica]|uniref:Uncharacterized protein n=1 Tax=Eumeta variegata TaxID=151549 RepID=A0A4C1T8F0_EUMVA|nr:hypothetical protein EVAR_73691_1 [Eumeta japonica]
MDLADPMLNKSSKIVLILGNDYGHLINLERLKNNICGEANGTTSTLGGCYVGLSRGKSVNHSQTLLWQMILLIYGLYSKGFRKEQEISLEHKMSAEHEFCVGDA